MSQKVESDEKSLFEWIGGSEQKGGEGALIQKVSTFAPWLVNVRNENKQSVYSWHKKNLRLALAGVAVLLFVAIIWDQSGSEKPTINAESNKFTNPTEIQLNQNALPSINPNEIRSNNLPAIPDIK